MDINIQVERQINERSSFSPLEWLMDSGRLIYSDYEAWRNEEISTLEDVILGDISKISLQLTKAIRHAESLGMKKEDVEFNAWNNEGSIKLQISHTASLSQLLGCKFLRVKDSPQLDLFFDNPVIFIENGLRSALGSRNMKQAQRLLNQLSEQDPNHRHLHHFESLVAYLGHIDKALSLDSKSDVDPIAEELVGLEKIIEPLAKECLHEHCRDYLVPAWRRLAFSMEAHPFDSKHPKLHASYAWQKALDWPETKKSVEKENDFTCHYDLCLRLTLAEYLLQRREHSISLWCQLFWLDEDRAEKDIFSQPDVSLLHHWNRFIDQDEEMETGWFPAWLLIAEPGLAHHISSSDNSDNSDNINAFEHAFYTCLRLLLNKQNEVAELALRKKLSNIQPTLLRLYQQKVSRVS